MTVVTVEVVIGVVAVAGIVVVITAIFTPMQDHTWTDNSHDVGFVYGCDFLSSIAHGKVKGITGNALTLFSCDDLQTFHNAWNILKETEACPATHLLIFFITVIIKTTVLILLCIIMIVLITTIIVMVMPTTRYHNTQCFRQNPAIYSN